MRAQVIPPAPEIVHLQDVYDIDMGRRTVDLDLWTRLVREAGSRAVCEVGCGDGRILRGVNERGTFPDAWVGIDLSARMLSRFAEAGGSAVYGDAADPRMWVEARALAGSVALFDLVIVPFSTLFLVPHDQQVDVLRNAGASLRRGGRLAVEVFVPKWTSSGTYGPYIGGVRTPKDRPFEDGTWVRRVSYEVDGAARITRARRLYGPAEGGGKFEPVYQLTETIYWRDPAALVFLAGEAGLAGAVLEMNQPEHGNAVLIARN